MAQGCNRFPNLIFRLLCVSAIIHVTTPLGNFTYQLLLSIYLIHLFPYFSWILSLSPPAENSSAIMQCCVKTVDLTEIQLSQRTGGEYRPHALISSPSNGQQMNSWAEKVIRKCGRPKCKPQIYTHISPIAIHYRNESHQCHSWVVDARKDISKCQVQPMCKQVLITLFKTK